MVERLNHKGRHHTDSSRRTVEGVADTPVRATSWPSETPVAAAV
jgi:hypothetical protein